MSQVFFFVVLDLAEIRVEDIYANTQTTLKSMKSVHEKKKDDIAR